VTRQRLHHGRGSRKPFSRWSVIPHGWDDQHRPVADATHTARVEIRHPVVATAGSWDDALQENVVTPAAPFFTGWARVQRTGGQGNTTPAADDPEPVTRYLVAIGADDPAADQVEAGDIVTVFLSGDAAADATPLIVEHVTMGSLRFERDLTCTLNPHQTTTGPSTAS